jgi:hypothetical protein
VQMRSEPLDRSTHGAEGTTRSGPDGEARSSVGGMKLVRRTLRPVHDEDGTDRFPPLVCFIRIEQIRIILPEGKRRGKGSLLLRDRHRFCRHYSANSNQQRLACFPNVAPQRPDGNALKVVSPGVVRSRHPHREFRLSAQSSGRRVDLHGISCHRRGDRVQVAPPGCPT